MRDDVEIVTAYLQDLEHARDRFAQGAPEALTRHRRAVRTELISLARHVLPHGAELHARYDEIDAALATACAGGDEDVVARTLARERELLVDDVLPLLIGVLDDVELAEWVRTYRASL